MPRRFYRGREAGDPEAEGQKMCRDLDRVTLIEDAGGRASSDACRYKNNECAFFNICGYQRQQRLKPDVWIVPHQLLFKKRREFIPDPDVVVIDESFWAATLHGVDKPYKVPISDLRAERLVSDVPGGTAALREISDKTCTVAACALGRLKRRALTAAGLVAGDFKVAYKLEWRRKIDLNKVLPGAEALPGMPIGHLKDICKLVKAHNKQVMRLARLWKLLIKTMEATEELSPWIEVRPEPRVEGLGEEWTFILAWRDEIHKSWLVPTILLDATLREEIVREFYPQAEIVRAKKIEAPHVYTRQVSNSAFAASKTIPTEGANDRTNATRRNNVERIRRFIEVRAASVYPGKAVVICQKDLERLLGEGAIPDNVELAHFNNVTGLNTWSKVALLIVIGRTEPDVQQVERITRALFGCAISEVEDGRWPRINRRIRLADGTATVVQNNYHPDPKAEAIRWAICVAELIQGIGRGRGIRRRADNPLQIDILTNVALPIVVDETARWEQMQPTFAQIMAARGAVPLSYADMAAAYRDLFVSGDDVSTRS
jgi:putative DNA primase/helicase